MLVVTNQLATRVSREGRFAGARKAEEKSNIAASGSTLTPTLSQRERGSRWAPSLAEQCMDSTLRSGMP